MIILKNLFLLLSVFFFVACGSESTESYKAVNWSKREVSSTPNYPFHSTYLPIYSQIYSGTENRRHDLTVTASIRNTDLNDTLYLKRVDLFDTAGELIKRYVKNTVFVAPMETLEVVIDRDDKSGGTGGNFLIEWSMKETSNEPYFEALMISTSGSQGISFTSQGISLK